MSQHQPGSLICPKRKFNLMNIPATPKPILKISARHIGPIMSLDASLSTNKQNLIFARNGTGKSFLARSLRLLDERALEGVAPQDMPELLVSEEATTKQGTFLLYEDEACIGSIGMNCVNKTVTFSVPRYIFHVFSEDYVDFHLRQKSFELDGEITHEIIVGQENLALDAKEGESTAKNTNLAKARNTLDEDFAAQKKKFQTDFQINASLGNFRSLNTDVFFQVSPFSSEKSKNTLVQLLAAFNKFKSLPNDPKLPIATVPDGLGLDLEVVNCPSSGFLEPRAA